MKSMKRISALLLSLVLLVSLCIPVSASDGLDISTQAPSPISRTKLLEIAEMQRGAVDAHEELYKTFLVGDVETYPVNYGGSYIDGPILHVCIVDLPNQDISYYKTILENYLDIVVFENVDLSLQTLITSSKEIAANLLADGIPVFTSSISEPNNAVIISTDIDALKTNGVEITSVPDVELANPYQISTSSVSNTISRQLYSVDELSTTVPVLFEDGSALVPNTALMGGTALTGYTLGICGTYNGQPAFAMCGHGLSLGEAVTYAENNSTIGTVSVQRYNNNQSGDYAIVSITNSSFTRTNIVGDPSNPGSQTEITGTINRPATGLAIIKYGKNGGYAYGNVSSSNTTWYPSAHPDGIHGLVDVRLSMGRREPGDSGGPIYTADGLFLGTHTGAGDEDGYGFSHIVFSPYVYLSNSGFSALTS